MFVEVQSARATPPTTGLVASAQRPTDTGWETGFVWRPERCITHQEFSPCGDVVGVPDLPDDGLVYYVPPGYRVRDICTTLSGERDQERVRRQAEAVASFVAARELWTGALTEAEPGTVQGSPYINPYLADGNATIVTPPTDLTTALRVLEQAAMEAANGQQIYLHVPISALPPGYDIRRVGNLLYTESDNVIVADAGYPGTGEFLPAVSEVQSVTITGAPTGGTFTLTFSAQTTGAIPFNAAASVVQADLNGLSNLDGVTVTGAAGGPYTVTFPASMGNVAQMTGNGAGLTGGTAPAVVVATVTPGAAASNTAGTWIYATGPVQVRLSTVVVTADAPETVDRTINRQEIWADRVFAATYDPCVHFAMDITPAP
jgi:hypothetical protein